MLQGPAFTSASLLSRSFYNPRNNPSSASTSSPSTSSSSSAAAPPNFTPAPMSDSSQIKTRVRIVPSLDSSNRCVVFNIIDRELIPGTIVRIGRFTDRGGDENRLTFKSKVVSRSHCEIWVDHDGKVNIRDTKSSSGTFVNHIRLSAAGQSSPCHLLADGDTIQLGVDYQGGVEELYRAVRMKIEIDRPIQSSTYSLATFNQLKSLTEEDPVAAMDECCICLYAIAPRQALFLAPCSHHFHYKCIRPLLASHPAFQCPLCRTYADLDASVELDLPQDTMVDTPQSIPALQPIPITTDNDAIDGVVGATFVPEEVRPRETTVSPESDEEQDVMGALTPSPPPIMSPLGLYHRRSSSSGFVDKLKMVIFDKRRLSVSGGKRRRSSRSDDEEEEPRTDVHQSTMSIANEPSTSSSRMATTIQFFGA